MECFSAKKKEIMSFSRKKTDLQHHVKQNIPGSKQQISHAFSDVWHLDIKEKYQNVGIEQLCAQKEGANVRVKDR